MLLIFKVWIGEGSKTIGSSPAESVSASIGGKPDRSDDLRREMAARLRILKGEKGKMLKSP